MTSPIDVLSESIADRAFHMVDGILCTVLTLYGIDVDLLIVVLSAVKVGDLSVSLNRLASVKMPFSGALVVK